MIEIEAVKPLLDNIINALHRQGVGEVDDRVVLIYAVQSLGEPRFTNELDEYPKLLKQVLRETGFLKWDSD